MPASRRPGFSRVYYAREQTLEVNMYRLDEPALRDQVRSHDADELVRWSPSGFRAETRMSVSITSRSGIIRVPVFARAPL
jgi:hypothetical protein